MHTHAQAHACTYYVRTYTCTHTHANACMHHNFIVTAFIIIIFIVMHLIVVWCYFNMYSKGRKLNERNFNIIFNRPEIAET